MLDRMDERRAIAKRIVAAQLARERVNDDKDVIAARAEMHAAQMAADKAQKHFNRVFRSKYRTAHELKTELLAEYPDLFQQQSGRTVCCCVTGLPIFNDDRVRMGEDEYEHVYVLADAVTVHPEYAGASPLVEALG